MHTQSTPTGTHSNFTATLTEILVIAAQEPGNLDDANELLYAIEDAAAAALFKNA